MDKYSLSIDYGKKYITFSWKFKNKSSSIFFICITSWKVAFREYYQALSHNFRHNNLYNIEITQIDLFINSIFNFVNFDIFISDDISSLSNTHSRLLRSRFNRCYLASSCIRVLCWKRDSEMVDNYDSRRKSKRDRLSTQQRRYN